MGKCYIDIGANTLGGYRDMKDRFGIDDEWEKIFIEPNPELYDDLEEQIKNIPNSRLIKAAVGGSHGTTQLLTRDDMRGDSAATIMGKKFINDSIGSVNQAIPSYNAYSVLVIPLSHILSLTESNEIYIKMDCEGAEYQILSAFPWDQLWRIKELFVEFHAHDEVMRGMKDALVSLFISRGLEIKMWY